jgi:hypothetical protein
MNITPLSSAHYYMTYDGRRNSTYVSQATRVSYSASCRSFLPWKEMMKHLNSNARPDSSSMNEIKLLNNNQCGNK